VHLHDDLAGDLNFGGVDFFQNHLPERRILKERRNEHGSIHINRCEYWMRNRNSNPSMRPEKRLHGWRRHLPVSDQNFTGDESNSLIFNPIRRLTLFWALPMIFEPNGKKRGANQ